MNLSLDFVPCSKKNNTEIRLNRKTGQRYVSPNKRVEKEQVLIKGKARVMRTDGCLATELSDYRRLMSQAAIPLANDVSMTVVVHISKYSGGDSTTVYVKDLGRPPKRKRTGRIRDAINVPAIIADALQGVCYEDDKQITELTVKVTHE